MTLPEEGASRGLGGRPFNKTSAAGLRELVRDGAEWNRCDITQLLANARAYRDLVDALITPFRDKAITKVAALDAMGFLLGGGVAYDLGVGLVPLRKRGKSAWHCRSLSFVDYSGSEKGFELVVGAITRLDRVLVVDDWSETGSQLMAAIRLIEGTGASVVGASLLNVDDQVRRSGALSNYRLHSVIAF